MSPAMRWNSMTSGMAVTSWANLAIQAEEWSPVSIETNTVSPMPIDSGEISATRRRMTPAFSRRWMRFQHGLCDRPTRCAICAKERLASSCSSAAKRRYRNTVGRCLGNLNCAVLDRLRFQAHRGAQPRAQALRQDLDVAAERSGIAAEPAVGPIEPGQAPGAVLTDQRAHDATVSGDGPQRGLAGSGEEQACGTGNELVGKAQHTLTVGAGRSRGQWNGQSNSGGQAAVLSPLREAERKLSLQTTSP